MTLLEQCRARWPGLEWDQHGPCVRARLGGTLITCAYSLATVASEIGWWSAALREVYPQSQPVADLPRSDASEVIKPVSPFATTQVVKMRRS